MKKKIVTIILIFIIFCGFLFAIFKNNDEKKSFSIVMAGDALITTSILKDAYNRTTGNYQFIKMFKYVEDYIKDYDLAFYNQETAINGVDFEYSGELCYSTPSSFAIDMLNLGFNMVSLANNHSLDGKLSVENDEYTCINNEKGIIDSISFWEKHEKIYTSGIYKSQEDRDRIVIKELNGIKYTLLSYTYGTNMDELIDYQPYLVNIYSNEKAKKDIERVKDKVDVIFVSMHWGDENNLIPNEIQKEQAKYLSSLGVNVIIGTHPHVVQPVEWIDNTLVIYSLGNLITAQNNSNDYSKLVGMMVGLEITKTKDKVKIGNVNCELTYTYYNENKKNFLVMPYSYITTTTNNNEYIRLYEKYSKIIKMYDNINININQIGTKELKKTVE